jgi:hypothetical protein
MEETVKMKKINFMINSVLISFLLTGAFGLFAISGNRAMALMVELGLDELTQDADLILRGEVTDMKSEWNEDKTAIYTYITFNVKERIHGEYDTQTITIKQRGGEVDGIGMVVSDCAEFKKGEEAIVFLKPERDVQAVRLRRAGRARTITELVGKNQGKYSVAKDDIAQAEAVVVNKAVFATRDGKLITRPGKRIPLKDFVGDIKRIKDRRKHLRRAQ